MRSTRISRMATNWVEGGKAREGQCVSGGPWICRSSNRILRANPWNSCQTPRRSPPDAQFPPRHDVSPHFHGASGSQGAFVPSPRLRGFKAGGRDPRRVKGIGGVRASRIHESPHSRLRVPRNQRCPYAKVRLPSQATASIRVAPSGYWTRVEELSGDPVPPMAILTNSLPR